MEIEEKKESDCAALQKEALSGFPNDIGRKSWARLSP